MDPLYNAHLPGEGRGPGTMKKRSYVVMVCVAWVALAAIVEIVHPGRIALNDIFLSPYWSIKIGVWGPWIVGVVIIVTYSLASKDTSYENILPYLIQAWVGAVGLVSESFKWISWYFEDINFNTASISVYAIISAFIVISTISAIMILHYVLRKCDSVRSRGN